MGGIDWSALPLMVELYGVDDVPAFVQRLRAIRDGMREETE